MNYVNREAGEALKEAGFDVSIYSFYPNGGGYLEHSKISADNWNAYDYLISAPDFLTAADWIEKESGGKIKVEFYPNTAFLSEPSTGVTFIESSDYPDRYAFRNKAILCALSDLKKLKETNS
jgi:hypothetical protein